MASDREDTLNRHRSPNDLCAAGKELLERELEAEWANLTPDEKRDFEHRLEKAEKTVESMNQTLDRTLQYLEGSHQRCDLIGALRDDAKQIFGTAEAALEWLVRPNRRFGQRRPIDLLGEDDGIHKIRRALTWAATARRHGR